jgi:dipeptidase E
MKLFLASSLDQTIFQLDKMINKQSKLEVLFIGNAADVYDDKWWVDLDRKSFQNHGYEVIDVDLNVITEKKLVSLLNEADIIHVCGGSVFHILSLLKEKNFLQIIKQAVIDRKIIYTGTSAGSIIASERVGLYLYDEEEKKFLKEDADFTAFGFVNFLIIPHAENEDFMESNKEMVGHAADINLSLIVLKDNQAVWVEDNKIQFVSA